MYTLKDFISLIMHRYFSVLLDFSFLRYIHSNLSSLSLNNTDLSKEYA